MRRANREILRPASLPTGGSSVDGCLTPACLLHWRREDSGCAWAAAGQSEGTAVDSIADDAASGATTHRPDTPSPSERFRPWPLDMSRAHAMCVLASPGANFPFIYARQPGVWAIWLGG